MLRPILLMLLAGLGCSVDKERPTPLDGAKRAGQTADGSSADGGVRRSSPWGLHAVGMPFVSRVHESNASMIRIIISGAIWKKIEAERGLDFSKLDLIVHGLQKHGMDLVITLDSNSEKWGAPHLFERRKGKLDPTIRSDKPKRAGQYEETLRAIAERYDGDGQDDMPGLAYSVDHYQIVNEWVWQWEGSKKDYLEHLKISRKVIRKAHAQARIILGGLTGVEHLAVEEGIDGSGKLKVGGMFGLDEPRVVTIDELKRKMPGQVEKNVERLRYILAEGAPHYDIIDLHSYTESYEEMLPSIETIKKLAPDKELWSMESGGPFYRYSPEKHSDDIVKRYVAALAQGVTKLFWSSYNPTMGWSKNFTNLSLIDDRGRDKAAYFTYRFLAGNMAGFRSSSRVPSGPGVEAYEVTGRDHRLYVVWADGKRNVRLPWQDRVEGLRAVRLHVASGRRIEVQNVALTHVERGVELGVTRAPTFVGRGLRQY